MTTAAGRAGPALKVGVLSNPKSTRNARGFDAIAAVAEGSGGALHAALDDVAELESALAEFARREVGVIAVNGGDGTVQATLTALINGGAFERMPPIAVLPRGMTNLIAVDVGLAGRPDRALARLIEGATAGAPGTVRRRPVIALERAGGAAPTYGMFFGAAAYYQATMLGRARVHPLGVEGSAAAGLALGLAAVQALVRRGGGPFHGERIGLALDGVRRPEVDYFVVLATTLDRLVLGLDPFWGDGVGRLRYTAITHPPRRLARALIPALRGRARPWMAASGYASGRADEIALATRAPMMFDGETVVPDAERPVVLRGGPVVEFVCG